jgi:CheY-like chemotaxis protein
VKILVAKHRGVVSAASEGVGKGSRFTVTLPLTEAPVPDDVEPTSRPVRGDKPLAGRSILIVEDDPDSREVLELFLVQKGARVKSFDSVRGALSSFGANGLPNIIISDLGLPDEDGYSLIQKIRSLSPEAGGKVPAIALSAFTSEESRRRALELGFNRYCTKPFEHDQLIKDLLDLMDRT